MTGFIEAISAELWALFAAIFLYFVRTAAKWVIVWIQENIKEHYATMAVELAETFWNIFDGKDKFNAAVAWLSRKLKKFGIKVSQEELEELIQTAWYEVINEE